MVTPSVPPQRLPVNLVRAGRQQPQREHCVPGCGWWGCLHNAPSCNTLQNPTIKPVICDAYCAVHDDHSTTGGILPSVFLLATRLYALGTF